MKAKFFILSILFLAAAGAGFYFGWVQIMLAEHTYGVIFTKTGGWDEKAVEPGTFSWRWEGLIPTNMRIHRIPIKPQTVTVSQQGSFPSGDVYAAVLDGDGDFDYSMDFTLTYSLDPSFLSRLVREEGLEAALMDEWYAGLNCRILSSLALELSENYEEIGRFDEPDASFSALEENLLSAMEEEFPAVNFQSIQPQTIDVPDIELYLAAKRYYLNLLETREDIERDTLEKQREWMVSEESKLEVLQQYGRLFTEYPGLIRYFFLKETGEFKELLPDVDLIQGELDEAEASE
jgi:hypothetical protein